MFKSISFALLVSTLSSATTISRNRTSAISNQIQKPSGPGYITAPFVAVNSTDSRLSKRQLPTSVYGTDFGTTYLVHMSIGTPPQPVILALDTGSSETWVNPTCSTASTPNQVTECNNSPRYDPSKSSSYSDGFLDFSLSYGKGSAYGEYVLDTITIGGATVEYNMFGVASETTELTNGLLAVGFGLEMTLHDCLIDEMAYEMLIASRAFSLDLGGIDSPSGALVFGGVDTKKYTGPLEKLPIIDPSESPDGNLRYWVNMNSVGITKPGSTTSKKYTPLSYQQAVVLDSGSTLSYLSTDLVNSMLVDFTGVKDAGNGFHSIDCSQYNLAGTVDFGFGKTIIKVPYHQFIWNPAPNECYFGAIAEDPASFDTWILGDTVMRSMYVVFDQDNYNIHVANYVDCGSNIVPIDMGPDAVPSITGACKAPVVTGSPTSSTKLSSTKTSSSTITTKTSSSSKISTKTSSTKVTTTSASKTSSTSHSSTKTSSKSASTSTKATSSTKPTTAKGPTTTFVSSYTSSHHRIVTTITQ